MRTSVGMSLGALLVAAGAATAQPAYESCSAAAGGTSVTPGVTYNFDTTGASVDSSPAPCALIGGNSADLWFLYTPSNTGSATLTGTCDTLPVAQVGVYSSCGVAQYCNGDLCGDSISFPITSGTSYLIRVGDYVGYNAGFVGSGAITITETLPPDNDACAGALDIGPGTTAVVFGASTTDNTFVPCADDQGFGAGDVWFRYTAATTGNAVVRMPTSSNARSVYSLVAFNDCEDTVVGCDGIRNLGWMCMSVVAGEDYYIRVAHKVDVTPPASINMTITEYVPPVNDTCAGAISLADNTATPWNNTGACDAVDQGLASCLLVNGSDDKAGIWYSYTAGASNGVLIVSTKGSNQNTLLQGYYGCNASAAVCDDNLGVGSSNRDSYISMKINAGQTVLVRLAQVAQSSTDYYRSGTIKATFVPELPNDECAGATAVSAGTTPFDNRTATTGNDGAHSCDTTPASRNDVWFSYTPASSGTADISTCTRTIAGDPMYMYDSTITVFDGCGGGEIVCGYQNLLSQSCDFRHALAELPVTANQTYTIRVSSVPSESASVGTADLIISLTLPPCAPDFNGVNGVTVQDIFDFLTAWLAGNPTADFNGVNGVTVQDIFDFLTAWLAGC